MSTAALTASEVTGLKTADFSKQVPLRMVSGSAIVSKSKQLKHGKRAVMPNIDRYGLASGNVEDAGHGRLQDSCRIGSECIPVASHTLSLNNGNDEYVSCSPASVLDIESPPSSAPNSSTIWNNKLDSVSSGSYGVSGGFEWVSPMRGPEARACENFRDALSNGVTSTYPSSVLQSAAAPSSEAKCTGSSPSGNILKAPGGESAAEPDSRGSDCVSDVCASGLEVMMDPCDLVSWPDAALDFSLDVVHDGGGEKEICDDLPGEMSGTNSISAGFHGSSFSTCAPSVDSATMADGMDVERDPLRMNEGESMLGSKSSSSGKSSLSNRRKVKVDWTPELHRKFVQAVEQLGVEKAIPSRILELMDVKCLTRHNIASHLQKYRSHRRHLLAKEAEAATWHMRRPMESPSWNSSSKPRTREGMTTWSSSTVCGQPPIQPRPSSAVSAAVGAPPMNYPSPVQGVPSMGNPVPPPPPPPHHHHSFITGHGHPCAQGFPSLSACSPTPGLVVGFPVPVWGHPHPQMEQQHQHQQQQHTMWQQPQPMIRPPVPVWYPSDGAMWQYPMMTMDAWGHPSQLSSMPPPLPPVQGTPCFHPQAMMPVSTCGGSPPCQSPMPLTSSISPPDLKENSQKLPPPPQAAMRGKNTSTYSKDENASAAAAAAAAATLCTGVFPEPATKVKEILESAICEALANPSLPLPLGLKSPSVDLVLEELKKQGITSMSSSLASSLSKPPSAIASPSPLQQQS